MEITSDETRRILRKLYNMKIIGGKHTEEKNCLKRIKNLSNEEHKLVLKEWDNCIKDGLILKSIKTGDFHVSINPRKLKELHELIKTI